MTYRDTRIWTLLALAAEEHADTGRVSLTTQSSLAEVGYELSALPDDIQNLNSSIR